MVLNATVYSVLHSLAFVWYEASACKCQIPDLCATYEPLKVEMSLSCSSRFYFYLKFVCAALIMVLKIQCQRKKERKKQDVVHAHPWTLNVNNSTYPFPQKFSINFSNYSHYGGASDRKRAVELLHLEIAFIFYLRNLDRGSVYERVFTSQLWRRLSL